MHKAKGSKSPRRASSSGNGVPKAKAKGGKSLAKKRSSNQY